MYFASRIQAGRMLAAKLLPKYRYENCVVLAFDDGGVMIGAEIAKQLHCSIALVSNSEIKLPQEPVAVAGITNDGSFTFNTSEYSKGDLDDIVTENRGIVEQEKLYKMHELNYLSGPSLVNKRMLRNHNVIIVADGLKSAFVIDLVYEFLKPVNIEKLVFAVALASVPVVDRMHVMGDELYCLDVIGDYLDTDHYYEDSHIPDHDRIEQLIKNIILEWK